MRLVKTAAAKRVPSTRCSASPWLDTSMATTLDPAVTELGETGLEHGGVGRGGRVAGPPGERADDLDVRPADSKTGRRSWVVVVLPLVPVTPMTVSRRDGWPQWAAAIGPMAARTSSTVTTADALGHRRPPARRARRRHRRRRPRRPGRGRRPADRPRSRTARRTRPSRVSSTTSVTSTSDAAAPATRGEVASPASSSSCSSVRIRPLTRLAPRCSWCRWAATVPGMVVSVVAGTVVVVVVVVATAGSERTGPVVGLGDDDGLLGDDGRRHGRHEGLGRRRDAEVPQAVAGQLGEHRRRHGGGVGAVRGLVDHHDDRQLRVLGGDEAGEGRDVVVVARPVLVGAVVLRLAGGAGLAGDGVPVDRSLPGPVPASTTATIMSRTARRGGLGHHPLARRSAPCRGGGRRRRRCRSTRRGST